VEVGDKITVKLCSNPTTGFNWDYEIVGKAVLKEEDYDYEEPEDENLVGASGTEVWTFEAVEIGSTEVHLEYSQPYEGGIKKEWTYAMQVSVIETE
jgi:inhibitor of cysteine peptidase